ncbi:MAG TPA: PDZ domain-containing protein, partial [Lentisphaeria bacterium]|nr:PDZ domain-containing protein [Lentisphaeria bacterium]
LPLYKDGLKMEDRIVALNGEPVKAEWEELCFSIPADAPEQTVTVSRNGEAVDLRYTPEPNPEWLAGLRGGDRIVAVNGKPFKRGMEELQMEYVYSDGPQVELTVQSGEESKVISYVPAPNPMMENLGLPFFVARNPVTLGGVLPGTPAADAGLQVGDQLLALNGQSVLSARKLLADIKALQGEPFTLLIARQNQEIALPEMRLAGDVSAQSLGLVFAVTVRSVVPDTPAAQAGFQLNDRLVAVNGEEVTDSEMFTEIVRASDGKPLDVTVIRDGKERVLSNVQARPVTIDGKEVYQVGLSLVDSVPRIIGHPSPWEQFENVVSTTGRTLKLLFKPLTAKLGGAPAGRAQVKVRHMSGPLGIILMLWYKLKLEGLRGGLSFIILITFSLALINLLPFPVLDGGHILFAGIEGITRRRMPVKVMSVLQNVFAFLLIALMVYITFFDGSRIFKRLRLFFAEPAPAQAEAPAQPTEAETVPEAPAEATP